MRLKINKRSKKAVSEAKDEAADKASELKRSEDKTVEAKRSGFRTKDTVVDKVVKFKDAVVDKVAEVKMQFLK